MQELAIAQPIRQTDRAVSFEQNELNLVLEARARRSPLRTYGDRLRD